MILRLNSKIIVPSRRAVKYKEVSEHVQDDQSCSSIDRTSSMAKLCSFTRYISRLRVVKIKQHNVDDQHMSRIKSNFHGVSLTI